MGQHRAMPKLSRAKAPFLLALVLALGLPSGAGGSHGESATQDPPGLEGRPNVLIIITDDQRARGTLGVMPQTRARFQAQGARFPNAFATTPTCCPSRASVLTGLYAHNHGVLTSEKGQQNNLDHEITLQRYLSDSGYTTGIYGKFLNGWRASDDPPYFDKWAVLAGNIHHGYRNGLWNVQGEAVDLKPYSTNFLA